MNWLNKISAQCSHWLSIQQDELAATADWFLQQLFLTIGEWVRTIRYTNGFTQESMAEQLGVDPRTVQRWEANEQNPRNRMLYKLIRLEHSQNYTPQIGLKEYLIQISLKEYESIICTSYPIENTLPSKYVSRKRKAARKGKTG